MSALTKCNECWINYHRKFDIILLRNLERLLPKRIIELWYGRYQWTEDRRMTYRQYIQQKTNIEHETDSPAHPTLQTPA